MVWPGSSSSWWKIPFQTHQILSHHLPWRQYGLCNRLSSFSGLRPPSFTHIIDVRDPLFKSFVSKMVRFRFVSAAIHKWKLCPLNFSLLIHVEPKHRASFGIQSYVNVCISLYSLPFTGFESLPESVQNKSLKITQTPPSNLPRDMEPLPWRWLTSFLWDLQFKVGSEPPKPRLKYLEKFPLVPAQGSNPEPPAWKSSLLPPVTFQI